jgi:hypothetical protein
MSIFIGSHDNNIYQNWQTTNNLFLNNTTSSNLLYLNYYDDTYQDASIIFKNNYQFGLLNNSITIHNKSNLFTANISNVDIYTDFNLHSNLTVDRYIKTSNTTVYLQSNLELNFNSNINNSFKIKFTDNQDIFKVYKDKITIYSSNVYASNIYIDSNSTLYTNFIDSPNNHPVVIRNMAFAEDLRILTNTVVEGINIDNTVVFGNLIENLPFNNNPFSNNTNFYGAWSNFMINNNIDIGDINFTQPNIIVKKIFHESPSGNIGGSNIVDFYTINSTNTSNKIFTINNYGFINIGSNDNINIPLYIKVKPLNSNIFEYKNSLNNYNNISIGSNGFLNIGSNYLSSNQLNIVKNNYFDGNNKELISLNNYFDNINNIYNKIETIIIPFNNDDFLTDFKIILNNSSSTISVYTITNNFIDNNITNYNSIYNDTNYYISVDFSLINKIKYPKNTFKITSTSSLIDPLIITTYIFPISYSTPPTNNNKNYNIIPIYNSVNNTINTFYIYKTTYNYPYNGYYRYNPVNLITAKYNDSNTVFSVSANGNVGIGTKYTDLYNLYVASNAKIQNLDCATLSNYLTSNITFSNNTLNNINIINTNTINANTINNYILNSTSNYMNYLNTYFIDVNTKININSNATLNTYCPSSFGIQNNYFNNYLMNVNISSNYTGINKNNGIVVYNNSIGSNPNLLLLSTASQSYPSISFSNLSTNANILLNNSNNLQILNEDTSVLINDNINKYVSFYNDSVVVFNDAQNNSKIYLGKQFQGKEDWISSIKGLATTVSQPIINSYGLLNLCSYQGDPLITTNIDNNERVCIGIGINMPLPISGGNYNCNLLLINYETTFASNVNMNSNLYIAGSILTPSDSNLKKNINKIQNSIEKINNISGYTYERIDTGNIESGLLAQEVIGILPEVVEFNRNTNHYNISYGNMAGLFVESIKALNDKINILTERISYLEKK